MGMGLLPMASPRLGDSRVPRSAPNANTSLGGNVMSILPHLMR